VVVVVVVVVVAVAVAVVVVVVDVLVLSPASMGSVLCPLTGESGADVLLLLSCDGSGYGGK